MPIDLINIDNLVLANDFEKWFERTNEIVDALNPLQMYDFYDNFYTTGDGVSPTIPGYTGLLDITEATTLGLKITRDVRFLGDMLIEIFPEAPLGFNAVTGRLAFVFTGPNAPPLLGTSCTPPNNVDDVDRYIVWDDSASVTKVVEASNMLPPIINCDHQFGTSSTPGPGFVTITIKGDLIVDGTTTTLSTLNLEVEDKNINLNHDGGGTPGVPGGNDTTADGGGITLLSTDGNKNITWLNAGDRWLVNQSWEIDPAFTLFTTTVEPQTGILDIQGGAGGPYPLTVNLRATNDTLFPGSDLHWLWRVRENSAPGGLAPPSSAYTVLPFNSYPINSPGPPAVDAGTLVLSWTGGGTAILFDGISLTHDPFITGFARNLNADMLDGCHASPVPIPFAIPCADAAGELDPGWIPFTGSVVKEISQNAHGLAKGNVVRPDPANAGEYILAQADTLPNTESVGVVSEIIDANNFELTLLGCVSGFDVVASHVADHSAVPAAGGPLTPGQAYFLSTGKPGAFTAAAVVPGEISKTVLIATSTTEAIVVNYVGGQTDPTGGSFAAFLTNDVFGSGTFVAGALNIPVTIVERTTILATPAGPGVLPLAVEDSTGAGFRTFEITLNASHTLELQEPASGGWNTITAPDFHTNSVTLTITQGTGGGHTPSISIAKHPTDGGGPGTIIWDNSLTQPVAASPLGKTTVYVLINSTNNPGVWYGSRAVLQI